MNEAWGDYTNIEQERQKERERKRGEREWERAALYSQYYCYYYCCFLCQLFIIIIIFISNKNIYIVCGVYCSRVCLQCQLPTWLVGWPNGLSVSLNSWFSFEANSTRQSSEINLCVSLLVSGLVFFNCTQSIRHVERGGREGDTGENPILATFIRSKWKLIKFNFDPICVRSIYESILH